MEFFQKDRTQQQNLNARQKQTKKYYFSSLGGV